MGDQIKEYGFKQGLPIGVEILPLDVVRKTPYLFKGPSKATFYQLIWITEGNPVFEIDFRHVEINQGELLIISMNQVYRFDLEGRYNGKMILFTDTFFNQSQIDGSFLHTSELLNPHNLNRRCRLGREKLETIFRIMEDELRRPSDKFQPYVAQSLLRAILLESERVISRSSSPMFHKSDSILGRRFVDKVEKHYKENRHADYYQNILSVSEKLLSREVKNHTGKTPKNYIDGRIVLEAKRLLSYGTSSVKEISADLGFDEPTNFNKFFRRHTGTTPVLFRQNHGKGM